MRTEVIRVGLDSRIQKTAGTTCQHMDGLKNSLWKYYPILTGALTSKETRATRMTEGPTAVSDKENSMFNLEKIFWMLHVNSILKYQSKSIKSILFTESQRSQNGDDVPLNTYQSTVLKTSAVVPFYICTGLLEILVSIKPVCFLLTAITTISLEQHTVYCLSQTCRQLLSLSSYVQFSSVARSCPTLCDPMNHSTPGLSVHH